MAIGAIAPDPLGFVVAFGAGTLSFLSPCVLPLVPGYVSMVSGVSAAELTGAPSSNAPSRRRLLWGIALFIAGFTVVFVALGAAASGIGHALGTHKDVLTRVAGGVVIALAAVLLVAALPSSVWAKLGSATAGRFGSLLSERRFRLRPSALGPFGAPVMGMAFGFAWTPCVGPVLGALLGLAATKSTLPGGMALLAVYSLGLGVPFVAMGLAFGRLTTFLSGARRRLWAIHIIGALALVTFGVFVVAGQMGWLSSQISQVMDALGLQRLTTS